MTYLSEKKMRNDEYELTADEKRLIDLINGRIPKDVGIGVGAAVMSAGLAGRMADYLEGHPSFTVQSFCEYAYSILPDEYLIEDEKGEICMEKDEMMCPVCGKYRFAERDTYEVCPVCEWEDDVYQERHPDMTGANPITITEAREQYRKYGRITWEHNGKPLLG